MYKDTLYIACRCLVVVLLGFCAFVGLKWFFLFTYPFVTAFLIAFILNPIVSKIETKTKVSRTTATLFTISGCLVFFFGVMILFLSELLQGMIYFADKVPIYYRLFIRHVDQLTSQYLLPYYDKSIHFFQTFHPNSKQLIEENYQKLILFLLEKGTIFLQDFLNHIPLFMTLVPSSALLIFFTFLACFFFMKDWLIIEKKLVQITPASIIDVCNRIINQFKKTFYGYLKAQVILISISGILLFIGLHILQIQHAFTITIIASTLDILPFIGTGLLFLPWIIYAFLTGSYPIAIGLSVLYGTVIISRQLLEPKIMATSIGISPILALFIFFTSWQIWGASSIIFTPIFLILFTVLLEVGLFTSIWKFIKGA